MGLDMVPIGKPKPGAEERFNYLFRLLEGTEQQSASFFDRLRGKNIMSEDEILEEFESLQISPYETIKAPRVGRDESADEWLRARYRASDKTVSESEFFTEYQGLYAVELAKELDGVSVYLLPVYDETVFRGAFLSDCVELIGEDLVNEAWESKLAADALDYGNRLMTVADAIAARNKLEYLKAQRMPPDTDEESLESQLHIVFSLARWLIFYGRNGHGYEADF